MSAGKNNAKLTATAAERVHTLEVLAKETRATPDQYDKNWRLALGTLGGGNHFIELAEDGDGAVWLTLALRLARRGQQDWQPLHQGGATAVRVDGRAPSRPRPRVSAGGPSRVCRLSPRLELGATVRAAQSQRDDGPRAGGGEARGVRRGQATRRRWSCSASTRITTSRRKSSTSAAASGSPARARSRRAEATGR